MWAARTWLFSAALSWDSSRGWAAQSAPALSGLPRGTRCRPCSHTDGPWKSRTLLPLGPSCMGLEVSGFVIRIRLILDYRWKCGFRHVA